MNATPPSDLSDEIYRALQMCELYYDDGRYQEARDRGQKVLEKYPARGFAKLIIKPTLAKYHLAMGDFVKFNKVLDSYLKDTKAQRGADSKAYGLALLDAARLYLAHGNLVRVQEYLGMAEKVLTAGSKDWKYKHLYVEVRLAFQLGNYEAAAEKIPELLRSHDFLLQPTQKRFNQMTNEFETFEATDIQLRQAANEYAHLLNLRADIARRKGDFNDAQANVDFAKDWIEENSSTRSIAAIENEYIQILLRLDQGEARDRIYKDLDKLLFKAEKRFGKAHYLYLQIQETLIEYFVSSKFLEKQEKDQKKLQLEFLERNKERRQSNFQIWDINQSSRLYYGKNNYQYAFTQRLAARQALKRQNSELAVSTLKPLYKDRTILPLHHPTRTDAALVLYRADIQRGKLDSARSYLTDYLDLSKKIYGENSLDYALAQQEMGRFLFRFTNEFEASKRLLDASSEAIQTRVMEPHSHNLRVLNDWVEYYEVVDDYPKAIRYANQAIEITEKHYGKTHPRYASQLVRKAGLLMLESKYAEVDSLMNTALVIFDDEFNPNLNLEYAIALETAANFNAVMGLYEEAESQLQKARNQVFLHAGLTAFLRKRDDNVAFSENADQLAFLYIQSEEYERAGALLEEIIDRRINVYGQNSRFLISPYTQLARLRRIEGEYTKADEYIEKARQIAEENYGTESVRVTPALEVLADIQTSIGDYESAKDYAQKALEIKTKSLGENNIDLVNTYVRLAIIKYYNKEEWTEVEKLLKKAEAVTREGLGQQNPIYAGVLQKTASIYLENGETNRAEENLLRARDIWLTLDTEARKKIADIDVLIAQVDIRQGNLVDAEDKLEGALTDYKKIFSKTHPDYIRTKATLAKLYFKMGDYKKTEKNIDYVLDAHKQFIKENFPVLSDREKSKVWSLRRDDFEFFTYFAIQIEDQDLIEYLYDNILITKSVLLSASKGIRNKILNSKNDSLIANYNRWTALKSDLVKAYGFSQDQLKEVGIDVKALQGEINKLEKDLSRQSNIFESTEDEVHWTDVQDALRPGEYAVELVRFREFEDNFTDKVTYAALIIAPNAKSVQFVKLPNGNEMEDSYLKLYRNSMRYDVEDYDSYDRFWKPIDEVIPDGSRIYFTADKAYTQLNLESLLMETDDYLIDKDDIRLLTTTKDLAKRDRTEDELRPIPANDQIALFGNPKFYPDGVVEELTASTRGSDIVKQLPGAQEEVESIAKALNKNKLVYIQESATEQRIYELSETVKPKVYHFATHGFFEPDISDEDRAAQQRMGVSDNSLLRSGLLFNNAGQLLSQSKTYFEYNQDFGIMTAAEVADKDFEGAFIIMSACETGLGEVKVGDGVYGLQRSFLVAGAEEISMSLFKVDDAATRALMQAFYRNWRETQDVIGAFREAKREIREEFPEPIYWGAFVLVGS